MTTYSLADLEQKREELKQTIRSLDTERTNARLQDKIDDSEFQLLGNGINDLSTQVSNLSTEIVLMRINQITIDPASPGAMLAQAINQLNVAATQLDQVRQALIVFAQVINVVTDITSELLKRRLLPLGGLGG
jgi:DNA repair exonuclease SbcCD ATPase subunit